MIAIDVELLTGRYVATSFNDRSRPEWPPHPARLFSALVATAADHCDVSELERRALEWLEQQGPPRVIASDADPRSVMTTYVPNNTNRVLADWSSHEDRLDAARAELEAAERDADTKARRRAKKAAEKAEAKLAERLASIVADDGRFNRSAGENANEMLPDHRGKQAKTLPSVAPPEPCIRYEWPGASPDDETRAALDALVRRMVRLGHSSSLVACRVLDGETNGHNPRLETWVPTDEGGTILRTVTPGQLTRLEHAHARHRGVDPRVLPAEHQAYRRASELATGAAPQTVFGEWIVLREVAPKGGHRLGLLLTRTEDVTRALRGALLHHAEDPPPAILSGHTPDGRPLERPHVAFLPLADVAGRHAGGAILGVAIVLPREIAPADRRAVLRAVGRWEQAGLELKMGRIGVMHLERITGDDPRKTLDPRSWTRPALRWASVTPIALDQNPGDLLSRDPTKAAEAAERAESIVATSCERIGLPRPKWVQLMRRSLFDAAPAAKRFMPYPRNGSGVRRVCVHVEMEFGEPVGGTVLVGAGRYFGLGLFRGKTEP
ncbi:MAG TPA: type I-U CRISPR-associated protein Csb2 [Thermoanaerobaculia bacterium]|nr:type I-U CRISPR-associated protein Csb2 [Thermoanaerobaculia bacterium]